jgi:site-specific recombinase XerD
MRILYYCSSDLHLSSRLLGNPLRCPIATHLPEEDTDIRTIQELLGHKNVTTTMIYTHVVNRGGMGVKSPADFL